MPATHAQNLKKGTVFVKTTWMVMPLLKFLALDFTGKPEGDKYATSDRGVFQE